MSGVPEPFIHSTRYRTWCTVTTQWWRNDWPSFQAGRVCHLPNIHCRELKADWTVFTTFKESLKCARADMCTHAVMLSTGDAGQPWHSPYQKESRVLYGKGAGQNRGRLGVWWQWWTWDTWTDLGHILKVNQQNSLMDWVRGVKDREEASLASRFGAQWNVCVVAQQSEIGKNWDGIGLEAEERGGKSGKSFSHVLTIRFERAHQLNK